MPESRTKEKRAEKLRGGLLIRYNYDTKDVERELPEGTEITTFHLYEEVLVPKKPNYDEVVTAIIRNKYTEDHELALINNMLKLDTSEIEELEYTDFQNNRELAKVVAKAIANGIDDLSWDEIREYATTLNVSAAGTRADIEARIEELD